ncbi:MAG: hypothetical protein U0Q18_18250 [Bryobacteraceae bacterium]
MQVPVDMPPARGTLKTKLEEHANWPRAQTIFHLVESPQPGIGFNTYFQVLLAGVPTDTVRTADYCVTLRRI